MFLKIREFRRVLNRLFDFGFGFLEFFFFAFCGFFCQFLFGHICRFVRILVLDGAAPFYVSLAVLRAAGREQFERHAGLGCPGCHRARCGYRRSAQQSAGTTGGIGYR